MTPLRLSARQETLHFSEVSCTPPSIELRSAGDSVRIAVDSGPKQAFVISRIGGAPEHLAKSPLIPAGEDYIWEPTLPGSYIIRSAIYLHLTATVAVLPASSRSPGLRSTSSAVDDVIPFPLRSNVRPGLLSVSSRASPLPSPSPTFSSGRAKCSAQRGDAEKEVKEEEDEYAKHPSLGGLRQRRKSTAGFADDSQKQPRVLAALKNGRCTTPDVSEESASPPSPPALPRRPQSEPRVGGVGNGSAATHFYSSDLDATSGQMLKLVDVSRTSGLDAATVSAQRQQQQQKAAAAAPTFACRRCAKEFLAQCTTRRCEASHVKQNSKKLMPALATPDELREFWDGLAEATRREVFDVTSAPDAVHAVHLLAASKVKPSDNASCRQVHSGGVGLANAVLEPESLATLTGKNAVRYLDVTTEATLLFGGTPPEDPISRPSDTPSVCEAAAVLGFTVARRLLAVMKADAVRRADEVAAALEAAEEAAKPVPGVTGAAGAKKKSKKKKAKQQQQPVGRLPSAGSAKEEVPLVEAEEEATEEAVGVEDSAAELLLGAAAMAAAVFAAPAAAAVAAPKKKEAKTLAVRTPPAAPAAAVKPAQKAVERSAPANGNNANCSAAAAPAAPVSRAPSTERRPLPRVVTVERKPLPPPPPQPIEQPTQRDVPRGRKSGDGGRPSSRRGAKPSPPPPLSAMTAAPAPEPAAAAKPPPPPPTAVLAAAEPAAQPVAAPQPQQTEEPQQPKETAAASAAASVAVAASDNSLPSLPTTGPMAPPPHGMPPLPFFYGYMPHIPGKPLAPLPPGVIMHGMPPPMPPGFIQSGGGGVQLHMPPHMPPGAAGAGLPHPGMPPHPHMVQGMLPPLPLPPGGGGAPPMLPHYYNHHPMAMGHPHVHMGMPMAMGVPMQPHMPPQGGPGPPEGVGGMHPPYQSAVAVAAPALAKPHSHRSAEAERSGNRFLAMVREAQQRGSSSERRQRETDATKPGAQAPQEPAAPPPAAPAPRPATEAPPAADSAKPPVTVVSRFHARNNPDGLSRASSTASASVRSESPFGRHQQSSGSEQERDRERDHHQQQPRHFRRRGGGGGGGGSRRSGDSREGTSDEGLKRTGGGRGGRQGRWAAGDGAGANPAKDSPAAGKALPPSASGDWTIQAR